MTAKLMIPYDRGDIVSYLKEKAIVFSTEYTGEGVLLEAEMEPADAGRLKGYFIEGPKSEGEEN